MDNKNQFSYSMSDEPIVMFNEVLGVLLNQKKPAELMALYWFYRYTAKINTSITTADIANKLKWNENKVLKFKKQLENLRIIEDKRSHIHIRV